MRVCIMLIMLMLASGSIIRWNCSDEQRWSSWHKSENWDPHIVPVNDVAHINFEYCQPVIHQKTLISVIEGAGQLLIINSTVYNAHLLLTGALFIENSFFLGVSYNFSTSGYVLINLGGIRSFGLTLQDNNTIDIFGLSSVEDPQLINNGGLIKVNSNTTLIVEFLTQYSGRLEFIFPSAKLSFYGNIFLYGGTLSIDLRLLKDIPSSLILIDCWGLDCPILTITSISLHIQPPHINGTLVVSNSTLFLIFYK